MNAIINPPPHRYTGADLDRAAPRRKDPAWLEARRRDPRSLLVLLHDLKAIVRESDAVRLHLLELAEFAEAVPEDAPMLGERDGRAIFALSLAAEHPLAGRAVDVREVGPRLPADEAGLVAYARALAYWHDTHGFCSRCGAVTEVGDAGHARACTACARVVFPRMDPAVIVLVHHEDHCLLGRSPRFPANMYSTLAGFVEPGESLEDTVRREIFEEAGVTIASMRYRSSQPWPFPQSLMLGFHATARDRSLAIDQDELVDARWFHRDELANPDRRRISLPRPDSIARYLVDSWLYGT
jgi:NAD+ diphosphatase